MKPNGCKPYLYIKVFPVLTNWLPLSSDKSVKLFNSIYYSCSLQLKYWHDLSTFVVSIFHPFSLFWLFLTLFFPVGKKILWNFWNWKYNNRAGEDCIKLMQCVYTSWVSYMAILMFHIWTHTQTDFMRKKRLTGTISEGYEINRSEIIYN